jgi:heme exporter protein B
MNALMLVFLRDLRLAMRRKLEWFTGVFFFAVVATLFPLAIGPEPQTLHLMGPGILWVGALLSSLLSLNRLFEADLLDGSLEQLSLSPFPLTLLVMGKMVAHWVISGVPLVILAPLLGLQFGLSPDELSTLVLTLVVGTPVLSMLGAIGAALTLGLRGGGLLVALLVLPLCVPVLIFGAGAVEAVSAGLGADAHVSLLMAMLLVSLLFSPWACAAALRIALE